MRVFSFWHHKWVMTDILSRSYASLAWMAKTSCKKKAKVFVNMYVADQTSA